MKSLDFIKDFFNQAKKVEPTSAIKSNKALDEVKKTLAEQTQKEARTQVKTPHSSLTYTKTTWVFSDYLSHPSRSKYHVSKTLFNEEGLCGAHLNPSKSVLPASVQPPESLCCKNCLKLLGGKA